MDICLEVMRVSNGDGSDPSTWLLGDIVQVRQVGFLWNDQPWDATTQPTQPVDPAITETLVCNIPRKCFVVITNLPPAVTDINMVREVIEKFFTTDGADPDDTYSNVGGRREWGLDWGGLTPPQRNALENPPHVLYRTWAQAKNKLIKGRWSGRFLDDVDFGG